MKIRHISLMLISIIVLCSCGDSASEFSKKIWKTVTNGSVNVDGVKLKYNGTDTLKVAYPSMEFTINASVAEINLTGSMDTEIVLMLTYKEFAPGDASFYIDDSELKFRSKSGNPALLQSVNGTIPRNLNLDIYTAAGTVKLKDLQNNAVVELSSGAGDLELSGCRIADLQAHTGAGDIAFLNCQVENAGAETGAGDITVWNSKFQNKEFTTGAGKVIEK